MVRSKNVLAVDPAVREEIDNLLTETTEKFNNDIRELQKAKREYASEFANRMVAEFEKVLPKNVLNMTLAELSDYMDRDEDGSDVDMESEEDDGRYTPQRPAKKEKEYKIMQTPSGRVKVPKVITPKTTAGIRNLKCNEVLFSVNGTPVLTEIDRNLREANKRGGILLEDLFMNESSSVNDLTPETRNIMQKLKNLVEKKATKKEVKVKHPVASCSKK